MLRCLCPLAIVTLLVNSASQQTAVGAPAGDGKPFRAGAYAMDITPAKFPVAVNGSMQNHEAKSSHDTLHARCLVLDDGTTKLAIVVCDSCAIYREIMDEAKALAEQTTGIPGGNILISATHTHSAPASVSVFQTDADVDYQRHLAQQIAKGIQQAHAQLEPARIAWAIGSDPTQLFNRRWYLKEGTMPPNPFGALDKVKMNPRAGGEELIEPAGPIDPEVGLLSVQARDGRPICVLANYSLHYVGGNPALSADYFGEYANRIRHLLKADDVRPAFVGIMSNGTSGDINNVNFRNPRSRASGGPTQIEIVADSVAQASLKALASATYHDWVPLKVAEREIELGVRLPTAADIAAANATLSGKMQPYKNTSEIYARETILLAKYSPTVHAKLQAMRIGDLGIVSSPCETFVDIGLAIKQHSPLKPTFTIELANGYNGYLPTPKHHALGGYETWRARSSYLEVNASDKILATLLELLADVAK